MMQVSTYRLDVEDVIEVLEDIVVVDESAAFRKQRLTKVCVLLWGVAWVFPCTVVLLNGMIEEKEF